MTDRDSHEACGPRTAGPRARALMVLGTHSDAGKSILVSALCRILARRGYSVAPFKSQNMSNNAGVTPQGGEMGRAQITQAEAAGIEPHTDMNPVLLKPEMDRRSQIVLNGRRFGHIEAANWRDIKRRLWGDVQAAYDRLASRYDVVVMEGAGSPAEVNLKAMDIVNLSMARYAEAPCLLVGDIDRGGVFAALAGTMLLLDPAEREQITGFVINKFRGDLSLLGNALDLLREKAYGVPCLGVVPFLPHLGIAAEDAVVLDRRTAYDGPCTCEIAVVQFPRIANFDEFDVLAAEPGVRLRYVRSGEQVGRPDAIILPGTKVTFKDLEWMRSRGLDAAVRRVRETGGQIVGVCGGFQMLGERLEDPEGVEGPAGGAMTGLGLLPAVTRFVATKHTHQARLLHSSGEELTGYEIHNGETRLRTGATPFGTVVERNGEPCDIVDGGVSADGSTWGTYLHNLFGNQVFRRRWLRRLGWHEVEDAGPEHREAAYERLADAVEEAIGWPTLARVIGLAPQP